MYNKLEVTMMKTNMLVFPQNLQTAIGLSGMTQSQIAKLASVTETMISDYLRGRFKPRPITIIKLARVLNVDPLWLAGETSVLPTGIGKKVVLKDQKVINLTILKEISQSLNLLTNQGEVYEKSYYILLTHLVKLNISGLEKVKSYLLDLEEIEKYTSQDNIEIINLNESIEKLEQMK
jgi:transcriptional regulator with XRE-family HTH domain